MSKRRNTQHGQDRPKPLTHGVIAGWTFVVVLELVAIGYLLATY